jgi:hypothetical protein
MDGSERPKGGQVANAAGVDVSQHNSSVSIDRCLQTKDFVVIRALVGNSSRDVKFPVWWPKLVAARNAGNNIVGVYGVPWDRGEGAAEADDFVDMMEANGLHDQDLIQVDWEPGANGPGVPPFATPVDMLNYARRVQRRRPRNVVMVYTAKWVTDQFTSAADRDALTKAGQEFLLWVADYEGPLSLPFGWHKYAIHQYGGTNVGGVKVDGDIFRGTRGALHQLVNGTPVSLPDPEPVPAEGGDVTKDDVVGIVADLFEIDPAAGPAFGDAMRALNAWGTDQDRPHDPGSQKVFDALKALAHDRAARGDPGPDR